MAVDLLNGVFASVEGARGFMRGIIVVNNSANSKVPGPVDMEMAALIGRNSSLRGMHKGELKLKVGTNNDKSPSYCPSRVPWMLIRTCFSSPTRRGLRGHHLQSTPRYEPPPKERIGHFGGRCEILE